MTLKAPPVIGSDWLTTPPLSPSDLAGRVSVILFWSIGCESSWVRLQELSDLQRELSAPLSVLAVHSPRFAFERDQDALAAALAREHVDLAVIHDPELQTWSRYSPGGWPATIVVDHRGQVVGASLGLDDLEPVVEAAEVAILRADVAIAQGKVTPLPVPVPTPPMVPTNDLAWPSGVALLDQHRIAVVDSGNNRIIIAELDNDRHTARVIRTIAVAGRPRALCPLSPTEIAVSIPTEGRVVAYDLTDPVDTQLSIIDDLGRPQGMALDQDGSLVIADAGDELLIRVTDDGTSGIVAGNGFTGDSDGLAAHAELAQPVAVVRTDTGLAFLDAATSNLRILSDRGRVLTVTSNSFTEFGLTDGPAHRASLQRPSSVAQLSDGTLAIADTGNSRIRLLSGQRIKTLGLAGLRLPEDLTVTHDDLIIVADTGNHRIVIVDPSTQAAWPLEIVGFDDSSWVPGSSRHESAKPERANVGSEGVD